MHGYLNFIRPYCKVKLALKWLIYKVAQQDTGLATAAFQRHVKRQIVVRGKSRSRFPVRVFNVNFLTCDWRGLEHTSIERDFGAIGLSIVQGNNPTLFGEWCNLSNSKFFTHICQISNCASGQT